MYLLIAGALEILWASGLKWTQGFSRLGPTALVLGVMGVSIYCLAQAVKVLPIGTAYAVWTGIGAAGTVIAGLLFFHEPVQAGKMVCVFLIIAGVVGLRFL